MGTYLNPGKEAFEEAVNSPIFVDKTKMIQYLNSVVKTKQKYVSVSRPRRFGKSMAADMICAYYDREADSRELFEQCLLSSMEPVVVGKRKLIWDAGLGKYNVIYLVMTDFINAERNVDDALRLIRERILGELAEAYPEVKYDPGDLFYSMDRFYRKSGMAFVIIIDEWDAVFREYREDTTGQTKYLDFLRDWMKGKSYIALAYMTGILPIKKYGKHSALNMFTEYSMMFPRQLAAFTGFTTKEVRNLCNQYGRDFDSVRDWYDGYEVSDVIPPDPEHQAQKATGQPLKAERYELYSPLSVVEAMNTGLIKDYWNKTESYEALAEYIIRDYDGLKEAVTLLMDGGRLIIDTSTYQNDMTTFTGRDDVLSLLIHLGYLGFDPESSEVFIPNKEILDEFRTSTKGSEWTGAFRAYEESEKLLKATWDGESEKVAELMEKAHNRTGNRTFHSEAALSYSIQLAYYAAQKYYSTVLELDTGKGYADIVYIPGPRYSHLPVLLIELKYDQDADTAISQIKRQRYPERLEHYQGNILMVGINYVKDIRNDDPLFKHHSCQIERV